MPFTIDKKLFVRAAQNTIDVLQDGVTSSTAADWLVLDYEKSKTAHQQLVVALEQVESLQVEHREFQDRAHNMLAYTEATVSLLTDNTAEAHKGRAGSAISQMKGLIKLVEQSFPDAEAAPGM